MDKTVVGLVRTLETAQQVRIELIEAGVDRDRISLLSHNDEGRFDHHLDPENHGDKVANRGLEGALGGAALGGIGGLILSLTALAVPGIGPLVAAGPIVSIITGAGLGTMGGGLIGVLTGLGVEEDEAEYYAEGIRSGGVLVSATVPEDLQIPVRHIMEKNGLVDVQERTDEWKTLPSDADIPPAKDTDNL